MGSLADAGALQVGLGFLGDVAGIAAMGLAGDRVPNIADQDERRRCRELVEESSRRVRDDQHVAFLDLLKAADRRAVSAGSASTGVPGANSFGREVSGNSAARASLRRNSTPLQSKTCPPWAATS